MIAMATEWTPLLLDTVTLERWTGRDAYGVDTFGPAETYPARVSGRVRRIMTVTGDERVSTATIYFDQSPGITPFDRVTLPARFVPRSPPILAIRTSPDDLGRVMETVYLP